MLTEHDIRGIILASGGDLYSAVMFAQAKVRDLNEKTQTPDRHNRHPGDIVPPILW